MERLQKLISAAGLCSRRKAEELIGAGRVQRNGRPVKLGDKASPKDIITVDGEQAAVDLLREGKINCVVECTPMLGETVMELAEKLKAGETVPRILHPEETMFTEYDSLEAIAPRGY